MKTTQTREIAVCDCCKDREAAQICRRCKCDYCLVCACIISGCYVRPSVCRRCGEDKEVIAICNEYADKIEPIIKERNAKLYKESP